MKSCFFMHFFIIALKNHKTSKLSFSNTIRPINYHVSMSGGPHFILNINHSRFLSCGFVCYFLPKSSLAWVLKYNKYDVLIDCFEPNTESCMTHRLVFELV
uniref:Uncharacterized protein n=1 Tax=Cacopsylla melanoneura TaxID=428564 RepID=A0A8D8ZCW0_9HEMI